jgi:hypothetical protein
MIIQNLDCNGFKPGNRQGLFDFYGWDQKVLVVDQVPGIIQEDS